MGQTIFQGNYIAASFFLPYLRPLLAGAWGEMADMPEVAQADQFAQYTSAPLMSQP